MSDENSPLLRTDSYQNSYQNGHHRGYDASSITQEQRESDVERLEPESAGLSYLALVVPMSLGIFLAALDGTIVISSYAAIGSELKQLQSTSWLATAYLLTSTSFQPLYGKLSDIFGRKECLLTAYTIFTIGTTFCGLSSTMNELILSRAVTGIGGGGMSTVVTIIMSDVIPLRQRGTWQAILNIVFSAGAACGAPLGGYLTDTIGWRWAFLLQVPIAILSILSVSLSLHLPKLPPADFRTKFFRIDFSGALTLVLAVFFLLFTLDRGGNTAWDDRYTIASGVSFIAFFLLFLTIELKLAKEPFAPKHIIANKALIAAYFVNFFGMAAGMCVLYQVSLYFQAVFGDSPSEASLWLAMGVGASLAGSMTGGLSIQATGRYYAITVVFYALLLIGSVGLVASTGSVTRLLGGVAGGLFMCNYANSGGITTSLIALIANAGQGNQAIATAVSYLFRSLGWVVGVSISSTILNEVLRKTLRAELKGDDTDKIIQRVRESLEYIKDLDPSAQLIVRNAYERAVNAALKFAVVMAVLGFISALLVHETSLGDNKKHSRRDAEVVAREGDVRDG